MARGRKAMSFEEKIESAKTSEATQAQSDFVAWLKAQGLKVDERTVIVVQKLYNEFLGTPEAEAARAERKLEAAQNKAEREEKALDSFMARARKLGLKVERVEDEDAE